MQDGQGGDQQWARSVRPFSRSFAEGARLDPIVHAIQSAGSVRRSVGSATMTTPRTDRPARASTRRTDPTPRELQRPVDDRDDLSRGEDQPVRATHIATNRRDGGGRPIQERYPSRMRSWGDWTFEDII
jgi:hypothetical protein